MGLCRFFYRILARMFSLPVDGDLGRVRMDSEHDKRQRGIGVNGG